ncbi:AI-2E family transporter [uncultured Jannaschia sp.]|uniref:AI-2E family transporter n=1 Tax=uncultured Jannaschia sp. TaxID=293347 RepID=UPI0026275AEE|nr:AI-2E family transporter [uncultured Jannaschia sp.]
MSRDAPGDDPERRDARGLAGTLLPGCVVAIALILLGWALRATAPVVVPLVFSVFLVLLVAPVDRRIAAHVPGRLRWLGHVAAMGTIVGALLVFLGAVWFAARRVVDRFPLDLDGGLRSPEGAASGTSGVPAAETDTGILPDSVKAIFDMSDRSPGARLAEWASEHASAILGAAEATMGSLVLIFFLTLLMLIEAPLWKEKVASLAGGSRHDALEAVGVVAERLRWYLLARAFMGLLTGILYMAWLWIFGLDLLIVWGLLAFFLNFIPTFGSLIAGILPILYAFLQKDVGTALAIGGGLLVIEQIMGNYVDPRVQGRQVALSPLVVLVALLFWGWVWGIVGTVLAVPVTIAITVISVHVRPLRPVALLLGDRTDPDALDELGRR